MKPPAVVIASAACWKDDLETFTRAYRSPFDVIAVNDAGWLYEGVVDHWATLHPELFPEWLENRPDRDGVQFWTAPDRTRRFPLLDYNTIAHWGTGSSSLFAVTVALYMGYDRIVLCGVPMESQPHADGASTWEGEPWPDREVQIHREGWRYHRDKLGAVRSMSGWTRDLLGAPSDAFLFDRTPVHRAMSHNTVRPAMADGRVMQSYWHCVACGGTRIYRLNGDAVAYHCGDCGRDFDVSIRPRPWYANGVHEIAATYPPEMARTRDD